MNIRQLKQSDDIRTMSRINTLAWRKAYRGLLPDDVLEGMSESPPEGEIEEIFQRHEQDSDGIRLAEDDGGTVHGYVYFRWEAETKEFVGENEAGLKEIYVLPDSWGNGIGTRLLESGLELLPENVRQVKLEMLSGNDVGHQFYVSRGFERTGTSDFEIAGQSYSTDIYTLEL